jgi:Cd2+/Zn2+-exporting ATPase
MSRRPFPLPVVAAPAPAPAADHGHDRGHGHAHDHGPAGHAHAHAEDACCGGGACAAPAAPLAPPPDGWRRVAVPGLDCAVEEAEIRRATQGVAGLRGLRFHLAQRALSVDAADDAALDATLAAIRRAGFAPMLLDPQAPPTVGAPEGLGRLIAALALAAAAEGLGALAPASGPWPWLGSAVAALAIALAGFEVYRKGLAALRHGRLNINALMTVAVTGAFAIGQWPEAAMVMALYALAERLEAGAVERARHAIQGLLALAPETARVRQPDGGWREQPVAAVPPGSRVQVRPGERVPLDGWLRAGQTTVDTSAITGESLPQDRAEGDALHAGTVNLTGTVELETSASADDSTLSRIIHAVEQAQASRAPMQGAVDRFAAVYTPAVFAVALAVALLGPWLAGWAWLDGLYKALVLLVIACPCALVISTPVTLVSALARSARRGVLVKGGVHLEQARRLRAVALDKTGTLTEGRPALVDWQVWGDLGASEAAVARQAATLAGHSDHPVARAIAAGLSAPAGTLQGFQAQAGLGVQGVVDGQPLWLGNARLIASLGLSSPALDERLQALEAAGRSVSLLASSQAVLAVFAVADTLRPEAREAVAALRALGLVPVMLSGDHPRTAQAIAAQVGIDEVQGGLLPADKLAAIEALQRRLGPTAMVGDGLNDAPALARADLGIAMGGAGTDTAMEAADVVVMNDDLRRLAETVRLSRRTHAVLWQNIVLALGIKAVFLVLALAGQATMWMAVFADMGASLLVVGNGLRLLRGRAPVSSAP